MAAVSGGCGIGSLGQNNHRMNTEKKRQTTLRVSHTNIPEWHRRFQKMQECKTLDALVSLHGPPHHKVQHHGCEIWHYPLGVESGMKYSIRVSVMSAQLGQVVFYFELASVHDTPPRLSWRQFWKSKQI